MRDRPSMHGKYLGEALVLIAREGRKVATGPIPDPCLTCAFRPNTIANTSAGTGLMALNCTIGADDARFACHHGMKDGEPQKVCAGYIAAKLAPWGFTVEIVKALHDSLERIIGPDLVRADFDAWLAGIDPNGLMDVYQASREWEKRK